MPFTVYGGATGSVLKDLRVLLVLKKQQATELLATTFPNTFKRRADGSIVLAAAAGDPALPDLIERVEVESPTLTLLAYAAGALLVLVLVLIVRRR